MANREVTAGLRSTRRRRLVRLIYPAVLVLATIGLSAAELSGSSIGVLTSGQGKSSSDPGLVAGTPRPIRADEWMLTTPLIVAQSHHGFAPVTSDGFGGGYDLRVIQDVPNTDWSSAFRPWNLPMLALDVEHGFAARWWLISLVLLLGAYLLLLALTDRTDIAILFSLGLWLSPMLQWWYASGTLDSIGMGMLALGAFLYSLRASTLMRRIAWLALSAYAAISFTLVFYPPFQIPTVLLLAVVGVCEVLGRRNERKVDWRRLITSLGAVASVVIVILLVYYVHVPAIKAINDTAYPGNRQLNGGGTSLLQLLSAPFGLALAGSSVNTPGQLHTLGSTDQEGISSFILLGPFVLLQLLRVRLREFTTRWRYLLLGTAGVFVLFTIWYLVSLPPILAHVLLLDRVEPERMIFGVGVAGILLMALFCAAEFRHPEFSDSAPDDSVRRLGEDRRRRINTGAAICGVIAFFVYFWAGRNLISTYPDLKMTLWVAGLASAAAALVVLLTSARKVVLGGLALVLFGATISLTVNPLYKGLGPLTSSSLLTTFRRDATKPQEPSDRTWLSFADSAVTDVLIASGVQSLGDVQIYPHAKIWKQLKLQRGSVFTVAFGGPTMSPARVWNRYADLSFDPAPSNEPFTATLLLQNHIRIDIDPCGAAARILKVGFVVSQSPLSTQCLTLDSTSRQPNAGRVYVYSRASSTDNLNG